ncbi:cingulin-like [Acanthochromis polyacanthus]|uniref:cingulin-like n=1 Tax=Acanthochromis polyacanthus TaxID=80966 RepID=UPI0022346F88|nr:cingulin-like [Acanthochromis polyacanthus]
MCASVLSSWYKLLLGVKQLGGMRGVFGNQETRNSFSAENIPEIAAIFAGWCSCSGHAHEANSCQGKQQPVSRQQEPAEEQREQIPDLQRNKDDFPASLENLRQLIKDKVHILQSPVAEEQQGLVFEDSTGSEGLWRFAVLSKELTFHLQQLQKQTEQELSSIQTQLFQNKSRQQLLTTELFDLQQKKKQTEEELKRNFCLQTSTFELCACRELQASISERLVQSERLSFQEDALSALRDLLTQDLHRYQEETQRLTGFTLKVLGRRSDGEESFSIRITDNSMQGKNETEQQNNMESEFDSNKHPDSPSEEEPSTPKATTTTQNPRYQLFLNNELKTNGLSSREADSPGIGGSVGENGPRLARWETARLGSNHYKGSLESLASRDWDTMSDKVGVIDSPSRVFNSPYATPTSLEYNPMHRMSEFKGGLSPATSEMNIYGFNSRSTSPVPSTNLARPRFSTYDTLVRRRVEGNTTVVPTHYSLRSNTLGPPNKKDFIEELTKQLDVCQKRNQFLEAESVEMEKERNQIRFEMRGLLVNNEDLLRTNAQLNNEMKRLREQMIEMDRENQAMRERCREMEIEVKQARDMMVEANTQEYAFNFLQQSLKNKIQDAEENLEKQTQHSKSLAEKLWLAERQLEELEVDKDTKDKKTSELTSTIIRLETELSEALQISTQAAAELNLHQKLRDDAQLRVEELEETLLEKDQELQKLQISISRLQGEVSGKLIDTERTLEDEIQMRERLQLQCKQAERTVDDLTMELQTVNQAKEDTAKQLKLAQEKMIDLESDLEELHDSEQRWAAKHKRAIEQTEQLQLKVIQEKDLNDQVEMEKISLERQLRELRLEVDELQSSRVQEDVISRAESRMKELENVLRTEERNKLTLTNTISKLERRINELTDQMEEEHRIATEQKDLMTQRIRTLKRQVNEAEEEASRKEAQYRHTHRELAEERENNSRLQRQLLDQHLQNKRKETLTIRQTLDNLRLDLSVDDEDEDQQPKEQTSSVTKV